MKDLIKNIDCIVHFVITDKTAKIPLFIYQATKPGLVSKSIGVAKLSLQFFFLFMKALSQNNLSTPGWEWFISENGGLNACLNCMNRHYDLEESVIETIMEYAKVNMLELLTTQMKTKTSSPFEYLKIIKKFGRAIETNPKFKEDVLHNNNHEMI